MNLQELRTLLDYHYWARDRVLAAVEKLSVEDFTRDLGSSFTSIRDTLVHIYSAEVIWCARWQGQTPPPAQRSEEFESVEALARAWRAHEQAMRDVLERFGREGVETVVEYRDLKGNAWRQVYWQMLQHVVNHASYHRGQVTTMLRQLGAAPATSMDLIAFYRTRPST